MTIAKRDLYLLVVTLVLLLVGSVAHAADAWAEADATRAAAQRKADAMRTAAQAKADAMRAAAQARAEAARAKAAALRGETSPPTPAPTPPPRPTPPPPPTPPPSAPTGVQATATSCSEVTVSWRASTGSSGYRVYYAGEDDIRMTVPQPFTSASEGGLEESTTYVYQVVAFNDAGSSQRSSAVSVTTPACDVPDPGPGPGPVSLLSSLGGFDRILDLAVDETSGVAAVSTGSGGLSLVDVRDPSDPFVYATFAGRFRSVAMAASVVYAIDAISFEEVDLVTIQLQGGSASIASRIRLDGEASSSRNGLALYGDLLYVAATSSGLHIFDVSDPLFPVFLVTAAIDGKPEVVAADLDRAYVGAPGSFTVLDTRDVANPAVILEANVMRPVALAVDRGRLYRLGEGSWIVSVNTSGAADGWHDDQIGGRELAVGRYLAGAWTDPWASGLRVFDLSDPKSPQLVQEIATPSPVWAIATDGDLLLTGDHGGTLRVYSLE